MKNLGIWTRDMSIQNIQQLKNSGFNMLFMPLEPYWQLVKDDTLYSSFEAKQSRTIDLYVKAYKTFKNMGYKKFILDIGGWGINESNAWWKLASKKFEGATDVIMYCGEFPETFIERQQMVEANDGNPWTWDNLYNKLFKPRKDSDGRFLFDCTKRNFDKLNKLFPNEVSVSSYMFQTSKWHPKFPFIWIMGQPSWHLFNTWWYSYLHWRAKRLGLDNIWLYQGNKPEWTTDGWEMYLLNKIGIANWIEKIRRKWFIYIFKD